MNQHLKKITLIFCICLISILSFAQDPADLVVKNGKIFTFSEERPEVQALAVRDGIIIALGNNTDMDQYIGPKTRILDVYRKLVIPGFIDAHCHFVSGGHSLGMLDLSEVQSIETIKEILAKKISEMPKGTPIFGYASFPDVNLYGGLGWPKKEILDEVSPDNPVVIRRRGGHAVWINSVALNRSHITGDSEPPLGGEIVKEPDTGEPTGILKEAAQSLLKINEPYDTRQDIERALKHAASLGLTGIHTSANLDQIKIYKQLNKNGELTLRVYAWLPISKLDDYIARGIKRGQGDAMVRAGFLKMYLDGTIGVRSAMMFEPFTEEPANTGLAQYEENDFYSLVEKAHEHGYQIGVHAIGDKAVHWVLNAYEKAQLKHGKKGLRHRVEHNTVNRISDTERFRKMDVIASMQPTITGGEMYKRMRLGLERARRVDMVRTLISKGTMLAWGTDWPVSRLNPMLNLQELVTRVYPEQRLTMFEALRYYTYGPAYASHEEDIKGTLEIGKLADMIVLSKNLFNTRTENIPKTEVLYTIVGGRIVFDRSAVK